MQISYTVQPPQSHQDQNQRLMLFDLNYTGHHAGYIQHLVQYWCDRDLPGQLDVLVSQNFMRHHQNVVALGSKSERVNFISITDEEQAELLDGGAALEQSFTGRIKRAFYEWQILQKYTVALGTTHCLLMHLDTVFLRFALGGKFPCPFSCIYFRPIFHYSSFPNYVPAGRERLWQWRDRVCLAQLLRQSQLQTLFCLDPFAVEQINQLDPKARAMYLQDPVQIYKHQVSSADLLTAMGVQPGRKVFLLFGALGERKGIYPLLEAIESLSPYLGQRLCLMLVGPIQLQSQEVLQARIDQIRQKLPVQIINHHEFVPDHAIQPYFQIADVVLAPYQRHIGMSAILVRAAAAQTPVLASDFGLMGEVTRRYDLGLAVDSTQPAEIAKGIERFLLESPTSLCNAARMRQFADQNKAEGFASKVFQQLTSRTGAAPYTGSRLG